MSMGGKRGGSVDGRALKIALALMVVFVGVLLVFDVGKTTGYLVKEDGTVFVDLEIPQQYERVYPGENVVVETNILYRGGNIESTVPVLLEYAVADLGGNVISRKEGKGALAIKLSSVTSLLIPTTARPGVYVASVKVTSDEVNAVGSKTFEIIKRPSAGSDLLVIAGYGFLILFVVFVIIFLLYHFFSRGSRVRKQTRGDY